MNDKRLVRIRWIIIILEIIGFMILILNILANMNIIDLPLITIDPYKPHSLEEIKISSQIIVYTNLLGYLLLIISISIRIFISKINKSVKHNNINLFHIMFMIILIIIIGLSLLITLFNIIDVSIPL